MADEFLKWFSGAKSTKEYSIAPGIVTNNVDTFAEGRIEVRIPSRGGFSPLARLVGIGGGFDKGFFWIPRPYDEVLVAFHQTDIRDAYIIGGLWGGMQLPPIPDAIQQQFKRVIKTGLALGIGQEIEFDDLLQTITLSSSIGDKVIIGKGSIEISSRTGAKVSIGFDDIEISDLAGNNISLTTSPQLGISIKSHGNITIEAGMLLTLKGTQVLIN